ncbi:hypothetical protein KAR91_72905 [Candidatus Pacearchaeota archaeon]|nr:hypothetical protein [Candidatus Pacearchaeota archaeon]
MAKKSETPVMIKARVTRGRVVVNGEPRSAGDIIEVSQKCLDSHPNHLEPTKPSVLKERA